MGHLNISPMHRVDSARQRQPSELASRKQTQDITLAMTIN